jgi:hypothetical protein
MKQEEKKINLAFNINKELQKHISSSKIIKYTLYGLSVVGGVFAVGFLAKIFNYTIHNINQLKNTIKK